MWSPGWWGANGETDLKGSVFVLKGGGAYAKQKLASRLQAVEELAGIISTA
jgi:hypothetical protein